MEIHEARTLVTQGHWWEDLKGFSHPHPGDERKIPTRDQTNGKKHLRAKAS